MKIYSYKKVWKHEKKIYAIQNLQLPVPVSLNDMGLFFLGLSLSFIIGKIFPIYRHSGPIVCYLALPIVFVRFMNTVTFDGKNPILFLCGCIRYLIFNYKTHIERFVTQSINEPKTFNLKWYVGKGSIDELKLFGKPINLKWNAGKGEP